MKKFAISLIFTKDSLRSINVQNILRIVNANTKEEAFGIAFDDAKKTAKDIENHVFNLYTCAEIKTDEN